MKVLKCPSGSQQAATLMPGIGKDRPVKISDCSSMDEVLKLVKGQAKYHAQKVTTAQEDVSKAVEAGMKGGQQDLDGYLSSCHSGVEDNLTQAETHDVGSKSSKDGTGGQAAARGKGVKTPPGSEPGTPNIPLSKVLGDVRKGAFATQAKTSAIPRDSPRSAAVLDPAVLEICTAEASAAGMSDSDIDIFMGVLQQEISTVEELVGMAGALGDGGDLKSMLRDKAAQQVRQMSISGQLKVVTIMKAINAKQAGCVIVVGPPARGQGGQDDWEP